MSKRLYVIVRQDIDPGLQLAQVVHATSELAMKWPVALGDWFDGAEPNVVVLGAESEEHLVGLLLALRTLDEPGQLTPHSAFVEPDLGGQTTAFACIGGDRVRRLFARLPLALVSLAKSPAAAA